MADLPILARNTWRFIASLPARFRALSRWEQAVIVASFVYAIVFSILTLAKFQSLHTYAWDLGVYSQATYTAAHSGRFFYYTVDLPNNPGGSIFGVHFAPILFVVVPFLWIVASPGTLLVLQSFALAAGGVLVYRLARLRLSERLAGLLAFAYLLDPALQGVNWYDFHPESLFVPLALLAILLWERKAWLGFVIALFLALSTLESTGYMTVGLGLFWLASSFRLHDMRGWARRRETWAAAAVCVLGFAWAQLGFAVIAAFNPGLASQPATVWRLLGAQSAGEVPLKILLNPAGVAASLAFDAGAKVVYLVLLFGPVLFLPLRRPLTLLMVAPWLVPAVVSSSPTLYQIGDQYPSLVLPFLFYGAILGAERIVSTRPRTRPAAAGSEGAGPPSFRRQAPSLALALTVVLVIFVVAAPIGPLRVGNFNPVGIPVFTDHVSSVHAVIALVPGGASILTQNNLFPFFANRVDSYVVPSGSAFPGEATFNSTLDGYLDLVDYALVDVQTGPIEAASLLTRPSIRSSFGLLAWEDGVILLKRNWTYPPVLDTPYRATYPPGSLYPENVTEVPDPTSFSGTVFYHSRTAGAEAWNGPGAVLPPGVYAVTFRIRVDVPLTAPVITVAADVRPYTLQVLNAGSGSIGANVEVTPIALGCDLPLSTLAITSASAGYENYTLMVRADVFGLYTFPGFEVTNRTGLYLDRITAVSAAPLGALTIASCP